ncbi:hypothetical protein D3C87_1708590 [compost metagenome]
MEAAIGHAIGIDLLDLLARHLDEVLLHARESFRLYAHAHAHATSPAFSAARMTRSVKAM